MSAQPSHVDPDAIDALLDQAFNELDSGQLDRAQHSFHDVLKLDPQQFDALHMLGVIAMQARDFTRSVEWIAQALQVDPTFGTAQLNMALACMGINDPKQALKHFDHALALEPGNEQAIKGRQAAIQAIERPGQLMNNLNTVIQNQPDNLEARLARAHALLDQARHAQALEDYQFILSQDPGQASAWAGQGLALQKSGQMEQAMASYRRSLQIQPDQIPVLVNLGGMLRDAGRAAEALPLCERATLLAPTQPQAWMNHGNACLDLGRLPAARESFARVCALQPDNPEAQWALGWAALLDGEWALGLPQLEWRWKKASFASPSRTFSQAQWRGEELAGKTILLHAEQGLGDTLQFCRYAPLLAAAGARVLLEVQAPLTRLLERLHPEVKVLAAGSSPLPPFDLHCPLMSLPMALGERPDRLSTSAPYLTANEAHVQLWRQQLGPQTAPRVGVVWSGNAAHSNDRWRSMPLSTVLSALPTGLDYVCLQKDLREEDARLLASQPHIARPTIQSFEDTAALVALMDVVVTVDTSVAHLAAGMGRPTWILLPQVPDWRWLMDRPDTPWYPSAHLFRQRQWGQWDEPLSAVQQALRQLTRS